MTKPVEISRPVLQAVICSGDTLAEVERWLVVQGYDDAAITRILARVIRGRERLAATNEPEVH